MADSFWHYKGNTSKRANSLWNNRIPKDFTHQKFKIFVNLIECIVCPEGRALFHAVKNNMILTV